MDTFKDFFNGFAGRLILMLLTGLTSIVSTVGTVYIKSLNGDLESIKKEISTLNEAAKRSDYEKLNVNDYNQQQLLVNERFHTMDVRAIKLEETSKTTADTLMRIERKLGERAQ